MKKKNLTAPEHAKIVKKIIYKLYDAEEPSVTPLYFTLAGLRNHVVNVLWEGFEKTQSEDEVQDFTQVELVESDENLFAYLQGWMYAVDRIVITDLK